MLLKALSSASPHMKYLLVNLKSTDASHKKKQNKRKQERSIRVSAFLFHKR